MADGGLDRRSFLKAGLAAAAVGAAGAGGCAGTQNLVQAGAVPAVGRKRNGLNVIQIILHDTGQAFGCYGMDVKTPCVDAFAAEGVRFSNHFCNSTPCSPARGCAMTGLYAHHNGLIGLVNRGWDIPDGVPTMVDRFNDGGYETVLCGLQHERHPRKGNAMHYRKMFSTRGNPDPEKREISVERVCKAAQGYLQGRQAGEGEGQKPFYLNLGIFETHAPWSRQCYKAHTPAAEAVKMPAFLPDVPLMRQPWAAFLGALTYTDQCLGEFFTFLKTSGIDRNTLVVFTVDHGVSFPRAKSSVYEAGMETAMIMKLPGVIKAGRVAGELVSHVDLMPTLLDACGLDVPDGVDGRSYWPLLTGRAYEPNRYVFTERNFHENFDPMRTVRDERYKYIRNFSARPDRPSVKEFEAMGLTRQNEFWITPSQRPRPLEELYDLQADPHETVNLADKDELRPVKKRLRDALFAWMNDTGDFLRGADQDEPIMDMQREMRWIGK